MNSLRIGTTVLAAVTLSISAFAAEINKLTVEVPFAFEIPGIQLPAGHYEVTNVSGVKANPMRFHHTQTHTVALTVPVAPIRSNSFDNRPRLVFRCDGRGCWLAQLWNGEGDGVQLSKPSKHGSAGQERVAVVYGSAIATR